MTFEDWQLSVPEQIKADSLWKMEAYRLGLFLCDLAWKEGAKPLREPRTRSVADQVYRATANISSNIAEGYSRGTGKDRSRFYDYALGSARESRDWYFKARHVLTEKVAGHRIDLTTQVIRLLIKMSSTERQSNQRIAVAKPARLPSRNNQQSPA